MKKLRSAIQTLTVLVIVSSTALAGNIGGMRSDEIIFSFDELIAGNIGGLISVVYGGTTIP